jgi:hypothetical protein
MVPQLLTSRRVLEAQAVGLKLWAAGGGQQRALGALPACPKQPPAE